jgi:hypothetical protein
MIADCDAIHGELGIEDSYDIKGGELGIAG